MASFSLARAHAAPWFKAARVRQVRCASRFVGRLGRLPGGSGAVRAFGAFPPTRSLLRALVGYHRPFPRLRDAEAAIAPYAGGGHESSTAAELHLQLNETVRPSDYAALFHMRPLLPSLRRVFDLGGNVGNLFYCYSKYVEMPPDLVWQVQDLPHVAELGERLARERGARQLEFVRCWTEADGADLLVASGSLHYFAEPLWRMVEELPRKPGHVLINRTPLVQGPPVATVQDAGPYRVACMLHNRDELVRGFERAGYEAVDSWRVAELSLEVPGHPECSVPAYSGFLFRRAATPAAVGA